jgi:hypothetical protein
MVKVWKEPSLDLVHKYALFIQHAKPDLLNNSRIVYYCYSYFVNHLKLLVSTIELRWLNLVDDRLKIQPKHFFGNVYRDLKRKITVLYIWTFTDRCLQTQDSVDLLPLILHPFIFSNTHFGYGTLFLLLLFPLIKREGQYVGKDL